MIWDSEPWKRELARLVARLRRHSKQEWTGDKSTFDLERDVFYAAYVVRKLMEAVKLSDEVETLHIAAVNYRLTGRNPDLMNWHHFDEMFDLSKGRPCTISLKDFCNQFIHSFIFVPVVDDNQSVITGLFVASDFRRKQSMLYFSLENITKLLRAVSRDDIVAFHYQRDPMTKELKVLKKSSVSSKSILFP